MRKSFLTGLFPPGTLAGLLGGMLLFFPLDPLDLLERVHSSTHIVKRWPTSYSEPLQRAEISIQWLGTTGFKIQKGDCIVLIDPYLTRISLAEFFFASPQSNTQRLKEKIPKADFIFITDSHFDHCMDAPALALQTGAKVVGSSNTAEILRIFHVPESQIVVVNGGGAMQAGPFRVKIAKAQHGRIGLFQFMHGTVDGKDKPPLRAGQYRNVDNLAYHFSTEGLRLFATSGGDIQEEDAHELQADIVMANVTCLAWGYIDRLLRITHPKVIFPAHYDNFFEPLDKGVLPWPTADLKSFCDTVQRIQPQTQTITLDFFQEYRVSR